MDGTAFVPIIRDALKDVPTRTQQGVFWQPFEFRIALNIAQDIFVKYAIATNQTNFLLNLWRTTTFTNSSPVLWNQIATDPLLLAITAFVGDTINLLKPARIYIGGEGVKYLNVGHSFCFIYGDEITFKIRLPDGTARTTGGILNYYTFPREFYITGDPSLINDPNPPPPDFDAYVYDYFIVPLATVILGFKEISNQRDFKRYFDFIRNIFNIPKRFANYVLENQFTGVWSRVGRPPKEGVDLESD